MANLPIKIFNYEKILFTNISNILNKKLKNIKLTSTTKYNNFYGCNIVNIYKSNNNVVEINKLEFNSNSNISWYRIKVNNIIVYDSLQKIEI